MSTPISRDEQHADEMRQAAGTPTSRTTPWPDWPWPTATNSCPRLRAGWPVLQRARTGTSRRGRSPRSPSPDRTGSSFSVCGTTAIGPIGITMIVEPSGAALLTRVGSDPPDRAGPVLDDHRLADRVLQLVGDDARDEIRGAAGREPDENVAPACPSGPAQATGAARARSPTQAPATSKVRARRRCSPWNALLRLAAARKRTRDREREYTSDSRRGAGRSGRVTIRGRRCHASAQTRSPRSTVDGAPSDFHAETRVQPPACLITPDGSPRRRHRAQRPRQVNRLPPPAAAAGALAGRIRREGCSCSRPWKAAEANA